MSAGLIPQLGERSSFNALLRGEAHFRSRLRRLRPAFMTHIMDHYETSYVVFYNESCQENRVCTVSRPVSQKQRSSLQTFHVGQDFGHLDTEIKAHYLNLTSQRLIWISKAEAHEKTSMSSDRRSCQVMLYYSYNLSFSI